MLRTETQFWSPTTPGPLFELDDSSESRGAQAQTFKVDVTRISSSSRPLGRGGTLQSAPNRRPPTGLLANQMQHDLTAMRVVAVFEKVETLPGAQSGRSAADRNGKRDRRKRRADMARHIVRAFRGMPIESGIARDQATHEIFKIGENIRIRVFLNEKRRRCMPDETGQKSVAKAGVLYKPAYRIGEWVKAGAARGDPDGFELLFHGGDCLRR